MGGGAKEAVGWSRWVQDEVIEETPGNLVSDVFWWKHLHDFLMPWIKSLGEIKSQRQPQGLAWKTWQAELEKPLEAENRAAASSQSAETRTTETGRLREEWWTETHGSADLFRKWWLCWTEALETIRVFCLSVSRCTHSTVTVLGVLCGIQRVLHPPSVQCVW